MQNFIDNALVNLVFFILETGLIVILLPAILYRQEKRRWSPMRAEIVLELHRCCVTTLEALTDDFRHLLHAYLSYRISSMNRVRYTGVEQSKKKLRLAQVRLRNAIDLYAPAIEPNMARGITTALHLPEEILEVLSEIDTYIAAIVNGEYEGSAYQFNHSAQHERVYQDVNKIQDLMEALLGRIAIIIDEDITSKARAEVLRQRNDNLVNEVGHIITCARGLLDICTHEPNVGEVRDAFESFDGAIFTPSIARPRTQAVLAFGMPELCEHFWANRTRLLYLPEEWEGLSDENAE